MSLKQKALSGIFWTLIQQFSSQGISFIVTIILARLLLPEQFGLIAILNVFVNIGSILMDGGMGQSLIRTENPDIEDYSTVFYFNLIVSFIIYSVVYILSPFIAEFYNQPELEYITKWYCIIFITNAFSSIHYTRLTKNMEFKKELTITIPSLILSSTVGVLMAYNGFGIWSLVVSSILQSTTVGIQLWFRSDWKPIFKFNKEKFYFHFKYGYKLTLSGILDAFFNNIYVLIIGKYFAAIQVGFFNRADSLKQLPVNNISSVLNKITFPLFAKIQDDNERLKEMNKKIMQMVLYFVAPTLLIMAALGEPLFRLLFTDKWLPAVPYFQILCWGGILYPIHAYNLNILKVKGRSDLFLRLEIFKKVIVIITIISSISFGIIGLLYGTIITSIIAFFINTYYTGKLINYSSFKQLKDLTPILIVAALTGGLVYSLDVLLLNKILNDIFRLIVGSIFGIIIFYLLSILLRLDSLNELKLIIKKK
jgi:O-antigen/teichoic acid export membrane protein